MRLGRARLILSQASRRHLAKPATLARFQEEDAFTSARVRGETGPPAGSRAGEAGPLPAAPLTKEPGDSLDLAALRGLKPEILGLGHQDCFAGQGADAYLARTSESLAQVRRGVAAGQAAGKSQEILARELFDRYYQHEMRLYPPDTILNACRVLVRRSLEREEA